jgi:hypothetical protein
VSTPNIALYAGGPLGPSAITNNLTATQQAGWTTITLRLFHIGNGNKPGQFWGDIFFNDPPAIITKSKYVADPTWPMNVAKLKQNSSITQIYASIGGGGVVDFTTIKTIYENNGNSFSGTPLEKNFQVLRDTFPAIDGIDMDCEDMYDLPSFVALCRMLIGMKFVITFCPFENPWDNPSFWPASLAAIEQTNPGAVKWWNLQCYDGGEGNDPRDWAAEIKAVLPSFDTDGFILAGDWSRWLYPSPELWKGDCPPTVTKLISCFSREACLGGGFIWNMDLILDYGPNPAGCGTVQTMVDYVNAIANGMKKPPRRERRRAQA